MGRGEGQLVELQGEQVELGVPSVPSHRTSEGAASKGQKHDSESSTVVRHLVQHATVCFPTEYNEYYSALCSLLISQLREQVSNVGMVVSPLWFGSGNTHGFAVDRKSYR